MNWFQIKEQAAGEKRLLLTKYLYKIFGKKALFVIAFFVSFCVFLFNKNIRQYSYKYLRILEKFSNFHVNKLTPFFHIFTYSLSLVDKIILYSGDYDTKNITFENLESERQMFDDIKKQKGVFFICNHVGNIELLQSFFTNKITHPDFEVNVFLSNKQSQIFNKFIKNLKIQFPIKTFLIENIGLETGIELKESLDKGNVVFIAGDRMAENNSGKSIETQIFSHKVLFPKGTYKLAKLMNVPIYFISAIKENQKYKIFLEKQNNIPEKELADNFAKFMEMLIQQYPYQFYNFFDFFRN